MEARDSVVIIGGGMMGCGIAAVAAAAKNPVIVVETQGGARESGPAKVEKCVAELAANDLIDQAGAKYARTAVTFTDDMEAACARASFVIEAIVEDLEAKQALFERLDAMLPESVIIVSNTSGLRITDIEARAKKKHRMATAHFWFPAHLVPLVEVVMSEDTASETAERVRDRLKGWGKAPVIVKRDLPGQLANRILQAVLREAANIVDMGLASAEDVDTAVKMGMGIRFPVWGPLEHVDAVGIDLCYKTQNSVLPSISDASGAGPMYQRLVSEGNLGYKTGRGFYDWSMKDMQSLETLRNDFIINAVKFIKHHG